MDDFFESYSTRWSFALINWAETLTQFALPILSLPRAVKRAIVVAVDASLCVLAVWIAFYLRLGEVVPLAGTRIWAVFGALLLAIPIFLALGLYRAIFRYSGLPVMASVVRAMMLYGTLYAVIFTMIGVEDVPRTVGIIQPLLLLFFVGLSRAIARVWLGRLSQRNLKKESLRQVMIYGAGNAGRQLAAAMNASQEMRVIGFLDDDDRLHGSVLNGLRIHNPNDLPKLQSRHLITDVLLALPSVSRQRRNKILKSLALHRLVVRTLPGLTDLATGRVNLSDVRELGIDDLLGREPVEPDLLLLNINIRNKIVLVTGAGGSIGSELCRQIIRLGPKQLLLVDNSEFALYQVHKELQGGPYIIKEIEKDLNSFAGEHANDVGSKYIIPLLASVCDANRMQDIMQAWKPETVYHAAAYKHVPIVEHNIAEGIRNNVWGTKVCAEAALRSGVRNFILISTDKAVRPTNVMGASKRLAEMVLQALSEVNFSPLGKDDRVHQISTVFSMVRFGNVLESSGSVVPLFREQIKNGGPITLTHVDINRYFMTMSEAAQLVIQASAMGVGGDVFILNMGEPVLIYDLAIRMIELSGLTVKDSSTLEGDIEITITGLRPGEKLYEELLIGNDPKSTDHQSIMKANEEFISLDALLPILEKLQFAINSNNVTSMLKILQELVKGYQPNDKVVDWIYIKKDEL